MWLVYLQCAFYFTNVLNFYKKIERVKESPRSDQQDVPLPLEDTVLQTPETTQRVLRCLYLRQISASTNFCCWLQETFQISLKEVLLLVFLQKEQSIQTLGFLCRRFYFCQHRATRKSYARLTVQWMISEVCLRH